MGQCLKISRFGNKGDYLAPPEFSYTGEYAIRFKDGIWAIKFLSSGTFVLLNPSKMSIDVFLVGGGGGGEGGTNGTNYGYSGGGGGGGYTTTVKSIIIQAKVDYPIIVGAAGSGGTAGGATDGGETSGFGGLAAGGKCAHNSSKYTGGGDGGSGGGPGTFRTGSSGNWTSYEPNYGGEDGSDGGPASNNNPAQQVTGKGQGTTTREFGEPDGELYSGGGAGGSWSSSMRYSLKGGMGCLNLSKILPGQPSYGPGGKPGQARNQLKADGTGWTNYYWGVSGGPGGGYGGGGAGGGMGNNTSSPKTGALGGDGEQGICIIRAAKGS